MYNNMFGGNALRALLNSPSQDSAKVPINGENTITTI